MRELVFELEYEEGAGPLMDIFRDCPELTSTSIASCVDRDCCWIVERFVGPAPELDEIEQIRCNKDGAREETTERECGAKRHPTVLERSPTTLVTHLFVESLHTCDSVYALAARLLEPGVVIQSRRRNNCQEFRILVRSEENVEIFYERFQERLREGISAKFGHLGSVDQWSYDSLATVSLPEEQRSTLRTAAENGYYETPREITLDELAEEMDLPRSTVSYRLRQAEAALTKGYLGRLTGPLATT
jgi:predicted DNA binding protein